MTRFTNGPERPTREEWDDHARKVDDIAEDIYKVNLGIGQMQQLLHHMDQLPVIASALTEIKDKLIGVATGKDHIPVQIGMRVVNVLLGVIIALIFVIGTLLVGEKFGIIRDLIR